MKNSLRMIGISTILWLGLGIGQANAITEPTTGATSSSASFSNAATNTTSSQAPGPNNNKFADRAADAGKGSVASEHQTVAMLLVGLGLLGFSARHRRDGI